MDLPRLPLAPRARRARARTSCYTSAANHASSSNKFASSGAPCPALSGSPAPCETPSGPALWSPPSGPSIHGWLPASSREPPAPEDHDCTRLMAGMMPALCVREIHPSPCQGHGALGSALCPPCNSNSAEQASQAGRGLVLYPVRVQHPTGCLHPPFSCVTARAWLYRRWLYRTRECHQEEGMR